MRTSRNRTSLGALVVAASVACATLVSCSSGDGGNQAAGGASNSGEGTASPFTDKSDGRQDRLVAGAKQEKTLNWYTSLAGDIVQSQIEGFNKLYPFIKVNVYSAPENDVVTRVELEAQAGKDTVDVSELTLGGGLQLKAEGYLADYYSPRLADIPDAYVDRTTGELADYATDRVTYISLAYNKEKIAPADAPKVVTDLLKPAFDHQFSIETQTTGVRWLGGVLKVLGEEKGKEFLEEFAKTQHPRAQNLSGSAMMGLISTGEVGIGPAFTSHAAQSVAKGAPVEWLPVPPVVANSGVEVVFKKAPHPNAAMLFVDYMLGPDSAPTWQAKNYNTPTDKVNFEFWSPEGDAGSVEAYNENFTKWQALFNELFG